MCCATAALEGRDQDQPAVQPADPLSESGFHMKWIEKLSKADVDRSAQTALADLAAFIAYRASQQTTNEEAKDRAKSE
jgi:hypothetical protein